MSEPDMVNHPAHYGGDTPYEVRKVLNAWGLNRNFWLASAVKYVARAELKDDPIQDLRKAVFCLKEDLALREAEAKRKAKKKRKRKEPRR